MNVPFTLYEYTALLVPGCVMLVILSRLPMFNNIPLGTSEVGNLILLGLGAFLLGHIAQALARSLITWLRWRIPWLRNPKRELIRRTSAHSDPVTTCRTWISKVRPISWIKSSKAWLSIWNWGFLGWKPIVWSYLWLFDWPLRFLSMVVIPWPSEPMFSQAKIDEIKHRVSNLRPTVAAGDGEVFTVCMSAVDVDKNYKLFSAQADLFRGMFVAGLGLICVTFMNMIPLLPSSAKLSIAQIWVFRGCAIYLTLLFLERHQHFEYLAAKSVYEAFLIATDPKAVSSV